MENQAVSKAGSIVSLPQRRVNFCVEEREAAMRRQQRGMMTCKHVQAHEGRALVQAVRFADVIVCHSRGIPISGWPIRNASAQGRRLERRDGADWIPSRKCLQAFVITTVQISRFRI